MRRTAVLFVTILSLALFAGCGGGPGPVRSALDEDNALVYGHIDMSESSARIIDVSLLQQPEKTVSVTMRRYFNDIDNMRVYGGGTFFAENIKPGKYRLQGFHSKGADYYLGKDNNFFVRVKKGSLHYLGTFKYRAVKNSRLKLLFMREGKFGLERMKKPGELELLEELLAYTKGTSWEAKIQKRIKRLKKRK